MVENHYSNKVISRYSKTIYLRHSVWTLPTTQLYNKCEISDIFHNVVEVLTTVGHCGVVW
jgi:hypothetical protein